MKESFLKNHALFSHLPEEDQKMIVEISLSVKKKAGELIFREGEPSQDLYLLQEGKVVVTKVLDSGETLEIAYLQKGDFFGEMELLFPTSSGRTASVKALEEVELICFPAAPFLECIQKTECGRRMLLFFCGLLIQRLRRMDEAYTKLFLETKGKQGVSDLRRFREKLIREWGF